MAGHRLKLASKDLGVSDPYDRFISGGFGRIKEANGPRRNKYKSLLLNCRSAASRG